MSEQQSYDTPALPDAFLDFMIERRLLEPGAAERARAAMLRSGQPVDTVLTELGLIGELPLAEAQSAFLGLPLAGGDEFPDEPVTLAGVTSDFLQRTGLLPMHGSEDELVIATSRPLETDAIRSVAYYLDTPVSIRIAPKSAIETALRRLYGADNSRPAESTHAEAHDDDIERLKDVAREAPIIRLVGRLVREAVEMGASDIHLEPTEEGLRVRYRVDGALNTREMLSRAVVAGVVTRLKILANLNLAERRLPQDGRIKIAVRGRDIDLRVSTTPTLHGESIVLRILDRGNVELDFARLGFDPVEQRSIRSLIGYPDGILLVTGPTGSGKTTTLYTALLELNRDDTKIFTVEDPIEYQLPGINQIQVKPGIGLDFAASLRSILRQDPDIVMVGEMRDTETARIAIQSALTGHLVLSTLHTNSAAASVTRLLDLGIEAYLVASTVRGIIAQRLVRRVCRGCCRFETPDRLLWDQLAEAGFDAATMQRVAHAQGCPACHATGYSGRTTIAEILPIGAQVRELILGRAAEQEIEATSRALGMRSLRQSGLAKVAAGETTIDELLRVTRSA